MTLTADMIDSTRMRKLAKDISAASAYLTLLQGEVAQMAQALEKARVKLHPTVPTSLAQMQEPRVTVDEMIAAATSATAVYDAMARDLTDRFGPGHNRRTLVGRVERLVAVNPALGQAYPEPTVNLKLAHALAQRVGGEFKLQLAIAELDGAGQ